MILKSYSNQSTGSMWLLQLNLRDSKSPVGSSNHGIPAEHEALCACRDAEYREYRYNVRRVSTVGTSVSPHSFTLAMSSKKRYFQEDNIEKESEGDTQNEKVNCERKDKPFSPPEHNKWQEDGCSLQQRHNIEVSIITGLLWTSYIWCYFRTYAFYHMLCYTTNTVFPSCLNIDSFRRPHQRQKHTVPMHPLPSAGIKPPYLSCPFRRCFKGSFDVFWRYVSHIKRNSSGWDQQCYVAEDSLFSPPPHQKQKSTWDNRDFSLSSKSDWKKEKTEYLWHVLHHDSRWSAHALYCLNRIW